MAGRCQYAQQYAVLAAAPTQPCSTPPSQPGRQQPAAAAAPAARRPPQGAAQASAHITYDPDVPLTAGRDAKLLAKMPQGRGSRPSGAPFIPPAIDKLVRVIMRHGEREKAWGIVLDASQALYNMTRPANPRPELRQRDARFVKGGGKGGGGRAGRGSES